MSRERRWTFCLHFKNCKMEESKRNFVRSYISAAVDREKLTENLVELAFGDELLIFVVLTYLWCGLFFWWLLQLAIAWTGPFILAAFPPWSRRQDSLNHNFQFIEQKRKTTICTLDKGKSTRVTGLKLNDDNEGIHVSLFQAIVQYYPDPPLWCPSKCSS